MNFEAVTRIGYVIQNTGFTNTLTQRSGLCFRRNEVLTLWFIKKVTVWHTVWRSETCYGATLAHHQFFHLLFWLQQRPHASQDEKKLTFSFAYLMTHVNTFAIVFVFTLLGHKYIVCYTVSAWFISIIKHCAKGDKVHCPVHVWGIDLCSSSTYIADSIPIGTSRNEVFKQYLCYSDRSCPVIQYF